MSDAARYEIKIDLQGLIRLLAKNLYAEADVFVRELIQNAHDSIKRRSELDKNAPNGVINLYINRTASTITITDNGSGLTESEIHDYLSTIGRSGTGAFRQELIEKGRQAEVTLIGQFGIGLLSAFVVAHQVEVETLSVQPNSPAWHWVSEGQSDYQLEKGKRTTVGTTITLHITSNYRDVLDTEEIRKAVKKYADFIPYPIYIGTESSSANAINAPWHLTYSDERERLLEYTAFVNRRFPDRAVEIIPIEMRRPYHVDGVLYISDRRVPDINTSGLLDVYQARMFVTSESRDLLPGWAKFIRGVIDSPDLTLTASRDAVQQDIIAREIKEALGDYIVKHLKMLAQTQPNQLERILEWHSYHFKGMALTHDDFFDSVVDMIPFETNRGLLNISQYLELAARLESQPAQTIFYFTEQATASQFYMLCNAKGLAVISAVLPFEEEFLRKYAYRHGGGVKLHKFGETGSLFLFDAVTADESEAFRLLEADFRRTINNPASQVRVVHFKPESLPALIVLSSDSKLRQELEGARRSLVMPESVRNIADKILAERNAPPIILHLNADNATVKQMARLALGRNDESETYEAARLAIYNNAVLLSQHLVTPENIQTIVDSSNQAIKLLISQTEQLSEMQLRLSAATRALREKDQPLVTEEVKNSLKPLVCLISTPKHTTTFAYETALLPALRAVLENAPYYWQVIEAEDRISARFAGVNVGLADISDRHPEVMMDLGYMISRRKPEQIVIGLQRVGTGQSLPDQTSLIRLNYPATVTVAELIEIFGRELGRVVELQTLNKTKQAHYLSPTLLSQKFRVEPKIAQLLSQAYPSIEAFVEASVEDIRQNAPDLSRGMANGLKEDIADLLKELR